MAIWGKGLRAKSMWALVMVCLIALIPAVAIGWQMMAGVQAQEFVDTHLSLQPQHIYYLATDGYLDQAGGEKGFGLGSSHFCELLRTHAMLPLSEQAQALKQALDDYRGSYPQRDDITLLAFKVDLSA